jgi:DNA (cytosine-5)-methyltransferase 1
LDGTDYANQVDLLVGGSPCQSFSTVGFKGGLDDARGTLFYEYARIVKEVNPKVFIYENVRGLTTHDKGNTWNIIKGIFKSLNYTITEPQILNAADYGIPQNRQRVFYVGVKEGTFVFPKEITPVQKLSAKDGISDLEDSDNNHYGSGPANEFQKAMRGCCKHPLNQDYTNHSDQTIGIINQIPDGGNIKSLPPEFWNIRKYNKAFERMGTFKPSNTIDTGHRNYFHYKEPRIPTVRESARLQSFPDDFEIVGTRGSQYKQVGNAVPPMLANIIANAIKEQIKR